MGGGPHVNVVDGRTATDRALTALYPTRAAEFAAKLTGCLAG